MGHMKIIVKRIRSTRKIPQPEKRDEPAPHPEPIMPCPGTQSHGIDSQMTTAT